MLKKQWIEQGYIDEPVAEGTDLKAEIRRLCREKQAVVLAHYYTVGAIQEVADFVGDSLALARQAAKTDAKIIVMAGVHFMAETCKLLSPEKLVLCPDTNAGCSLADSCRAEDLKKYKEEHPGYQVVSYVNTTAAVKALTDVVVTSGNARKVIDSFPEDAKIIFGPDYNLGSYLNSVTGRQMLLWEGGCHVHERFSVEAILKLKQEHPEAVVMAHLECKGPVLALADVKGSTADMLRYAKESTERQFIVATEAGILHEMQRQCPEKVFLPVPPEVARDDSRDESRPTGTEGRLANEGAEKAGAQGGSERAEGAEAQGGSERAGAQGQGAGSAQGGSEGAERAGAQGGSEGAEGAASCYCNECQYMKMNSLLKIYNCLKYEWPSVEVEPEVAREAVKPIERMLELS